MYFNLYRIQFFERFISSDLVLVARYDFFSCVNLGRYMYGIINLVPDNNSLRHSDSRFESLMSIAEAPEVDSQQWNISSAVPQL